MYSQPGDVNCPVHSLKLYLSKLNSRCEYLLQKPKSGDVSTSDIWYENKVLGIHKIDNKMKDISQEPGLLELFMNHCLRATCTTVFSDARVELEM